MSYMKARYDYWRLANFLGRIVIGYSFLAIGVILTFVMLNTELISRDVAGFVELSAAERGLIAIKILAPLMVAILGYLLTRAEPYYPKGVREYQEKGSE